MIHATHLHVHLCSSTKYMPSHLLLELSFPLRKVNTQTSYLLPDGCPLLILRQNHERTTDITILLEEPIPYSDNLDHVTHGPVVSPRMKKGGVVELA